MFFTLFFILSLAKASYLDEGYVKGECPDPGTFKSQLNSEDFSYEYLIGYPWMTVIDDDIP